MDMIYISIGIVNRPEIGFGVKVKCDGVLLC